METLESTTTDTSSAQSVDTATSSDPTVSTQTAAPERPKSFHEAVERLKAEDDSTQDDREAAPIAQTATEKTAGADKSTTSKKGPIPFEAHEKALTNARSKAVEEAKPTIEAEVKQRYAWADVIEEPDREELTALYRGLKTDLIGTLTTLIDNASQHPEHAKTLRSQAARLLSAARRVQGESPSDDDEPQPDIPLEDGRAVYSGDQLAKRDAWRERRLMAQFDQKLQPFQQDRAQAQQREQMHALHTQAADTLKRYDAKPHFTEHKADILALMEAHPEMTLGDAYAEVLATKVLPTASQRERTAVLADIHHKAGAGTLNPSSTTTTTAFKPDGKFTTDRVRAFFEGQA